MPSPGDKLEGLSRHSIYRAVQSGLVRSRSVRLRPDAKRGIPYVSLSDIRNLIENAASAAMPSTA
jgi:hypothetical protein